MQVSDEDKLNLIMVAINILGFIMNEKLDQIYRVFEDEKEGISRRLHQCESEVDDYQVVHQLSDLVHM